MKILTKTIIVLAGCLLTSCTNHAVEFPQQINNTEIMTLTLPATWTSMPSLTSYPTSTLAPSFTPLPSNTHIPTRTQTPNITNTPSATPWPLKYAEKRLLEFYKTNGNCRLPCWWGITPGETSYAEIKSFFAPYSEAIELEEYYFPEKVIFYFPSPNESIDYLMSTVLRLDENQIIDTISLDFETMMYSGFTPSYLLTHFGMPDQILISNSEIVLVNTKSRLLTIYDVYSDESANQICLSFTDSLVLWADENDLTLANIRESTGDMSLVPWEEFTNQNAKVLLNTLKARGDAKKDYCFSVQ